MATELKELKEVSKEEFYKTLGPMDVVLHTIDPYPYTTEYRLRNRPLLVGKSVDYCENPLYEYPVLTKYFLLNTLIY